MEKDITRVKFRLVAKTDTGIIQEQIENNRKRNKQFDYSTPVWNYDFKIYECWYFDSARDRLEFQGSLASKIDDEKELKKVAKKKSI